MHPLPDALSKFLPYFIVQMSIMGWMTSARVMPIMADVSQLICAHSILRAVVAGLIKPVGQKFKVTAKGGNRDALFVEWKLMRMFLGLSRSDHRFCIHGVHMERGLVASGFKLDCAVLELVQHPYPDGDLSRLHRATSQTKSRAPAERRTCWCPQQRRQLNGCQFSTFRPAGCGSRDAPPLRQDKRLRCRSARLSFTPVIVRTTDDDFAVRIDDTMEARIAMIRQVYSSRYTASVSEVRPSQLVKAVLARALR